MTPARHGRRSRSLPAALAFVALAVALAAGAWWLRREATPVLPASAPTLGALVDGLLTDIRGRDRSYQPPTASELAAAASASAAAQSGGIARARRLAREIGYDVLIADADGTPVIVLREREASRRGWGLFVFRTGDSSDVLLEVSHPASDLETAEIGFELFIETRAQALLIAGAHRDAASSGSADVAHRRDSVFHAIHERLLDEDLVVVQPHGFATSSDRPFGAVVSAGTGDPTAIATEVAEAIADIGPQICLYKRKACDDLGGTRNQQGITARRVGASFLHLEFNRGLRQPGPRRKQLIKELAAALRD